MAAVLSGLASVPPFEYNTTDISGLATKWLSWKASFEIFVVASGVTNDTQMRALLLHMGGGQLQKLFHTLPDTGDETNYAECVQALNKYFEIRKNVPKERQNFLSVSPEGGETINNFIIRLKKTVEHCEYGVEEENQIRDPVLYFIRDKVLKRKLFGEENLSLTKLQEIANLFDEPEALLSPAGTRENANTVYAKRTSGLRATERTFQGKCWKCDNLGHFAKDCRKSKNHTCEKCGKTGHFAVCCHTGQSRGGATGGQSYRKPTYESRGRGRGKQNVRNIEKQDTELGEEDTFYVFSVNTSACTMAINIDDNPVNMIIDSGSSCNIIPEATFRKMPGLTLKCCNDRVYAYASHNPLQVVGCCDVKMSVNGGGRVNTAKVLVVKGDHAAMLGRKTAEQLGVLRVGLAENVYTADVSTKETSREMTDEQRVLYLQQQRLPEEVFKKKKEDVLMHKLPKEEKATHSNINKFNHQWRNIMRESKANELKKKDIEILSQTFERVVDRKESVIKSLVKDLLESEEQYFMALRNHLENIDKLADFQTERLRQLEFANEQKTLVFEFDTEREMLVQQNQREITALQDIIIAMKQNLAERENEAKNEFRSIREEHQNKNLEAKHALGVQLETAVGDLWAQFQSALRNYQETTEERNKSFEELNSKDEKEYADKKRGAMVSDIGVGDRVILSQSKRNKLTTRFEKEPYDVVDRDGNAVVIQRGDEPRKMRNIAHMKKLNGCPETSQGQTMTSIPVGNRRGVRTNRVHSCQCGNQ